MDPSFIHNRRARYDCFHCISSYTLWYTQLDENNLKWVHVWGSFSHKVPLQFFLNLWFCWKGPSFWHFWWYTLPFCIFRPCFGLEIQSGYQPLSWSLLLYFWLWRCGFHLVQIVNLLWDIQNLINIQGDTLVTNLDLLVFPNFVTTTVFHVHRLKNILLACELFLSERLPSGATMINRRWCYNY